MKSIPKYYPICVDLDGTLVFNSTVRLLFKRFLRCHSLKESIKNIFSLTRRGEHLRTFLGQFWSKEDLKQLIWNVPLIEDLKLLKKTGRYLLMITGAPCTVAGSIAKHLGFFDEVIGTTVNTGLIVGGRKRDALVKKYGQKKFVYVGNSWEDLPVWACAAWGLGVNVPLSLRSLKKKKLWYDYPKYKEKLWVPVSENTI